MAFMGLIAGVLYSFGGFIIDLFVSIGWLSSVSASTPGLSYGTLLAFGALIGMPLIGAICGFVTGFIGASLYNLAAKWTGGVEMHFGE